MVTMRSYQYSVAILFCIHRFVPYHLHRTRSLQTIYEVSFEVHPHF